MNPNDIKLVKTCRACPEQYDAFFEDTQIAYLRLRHGHFSVSCPGVQGTIVYESTTLGDGAFKNSERNNHLKNAKQSIASYYTKEI